MNKNINYLWFFLLASFWSGSFVAIKAVVLHVPPFFGAMLRVGLALLFLSIIFYCLKKKISRHFCAALAYLGYGPFFTRSALFLFILR